ncbi:hypothetical protein [Actinoallomurus acaciae]|uniref:EthD domain-containing protein n=1 Tax=Actinoallomurus acaciae TaxID=502577 RepID=A0ABV5Y9H5_9ACTN
MTAQQLSLVLTTPKEGMDDAYEDWVTNRHFDEALRIDGVIAVRGYRFVPQRDGDVPLYPDLAVYETDGSPVTPPEGPAEVTTWRYEGITEKRYDGDDRPLRDPHLFVVLTAPVEGLEEEFNAWYTDRHLGDVMKLADYRSAQRFSFVGGDEPLRPYLAFYDTDTTDVRATQRRLVEVVATPAMPFSPAIDREKSIGWYYRPVTERRTS